jgi:hypothetical protein
MNRRGGRGGNRGGRGGQRGGRPLDRRGDLGGNRNPQRQMRGGFNQDRFRRGGQQGRGPRQQMVSVSFYLYYIGNNSISLSIFLILPL